MTVLLTRTDWTVHGPTRPLTPLATSAVEGVALHWPGTTEVIGAPPQNHVADRLEGYRRFHTDPEPAGRGWSDIAYQVAIDQAGRIWPLRGLPFRSAANGDRDTNARWVAVLLLVGPGEQPNELLLEAFRWYRTAHVLPMYPGGREVVGHRDIRPLPTECPGNTVTALIRAGAFTRSPAGQAPQLTLGRLLAVRRPPLKGSDVRAVQRELMARGFKLAKYGVDASYGTETAGAVRAFQRGRGLSDVDGIVGPITCRALGGHWTGPR